MTPSHLEAEARHGLCSLFQDPTVVGKSLEQLELIMACIECQEDVQAILPTGGGKSAAWLVPAIVDKKWISIIVLPFTIVLEDQLWSANEKEIVAELFTAQNPQLHDDVQLIFLQPKTVGTQAFRQ
jgi:superfamily II DNA helicase RecQ